MTKFLKKLWLFKVTLRIFAFFARKPLFNGFTRFLTSSVAALTLKINKSRNSSELIDLANTWQRLMPIDGKHLFVIYKIEQETAFTEIHLHCPLRGTGDIEACNRLMNYDRKLLRKFGGYLLVLESQSNSGQPYCKLAIKKVDALTT